MHSDIFRFFHNQFDHYPPHSSPLPFSGLIDNNVLYEDHNIPGYVNLLRINVPGVKCCQGSVFPGIGNIEPFEHQNPGNIDPLEYRISETVTEIMETFRETSNPLKNEPMYSSATLEIIPKTMNIGPFEQ